MCIIFYTRSQPGYKLILAANRDEYLDRPASAAGWHSFNKSDTDPTSGPNEQKWVLSGVDLGSETRGTWLGMTSDLRVGALTNIRHPLTPPIPNAPSRGEMLKSFLSAKPGSVLEVASFLEEYAAKVKEYEGFNLLLFDLRASSIGYLSNRIDPAYTDQSARLGCVGLSNSPLDQPWPKVVEGEKAMEVTLKDWTDRGENDDDLIERMIKLLSPTKELKCLADTRECTCLHPLQVGSDSDVPTAHGSLGNRWYATRISTVIIVNDSGEATFVERDRFVLDEDGNAKSSDAERRYKFSAVS